MRLFVFWIIDSNFNAMEALRIIGYDTSDSSAAIHAFKQHFIQEDSKIINEWDRKVLYNLYKKYL